VALRSDLLDAAVSAAKQNGHETVEPRHVLFAVAKRFRSNAEVGAFFDRARQALEPQGRATKAPATAPETTALLESITTEPDAIKALVAAMNAPGTPVLTGGQAGQAAPVATAQAQAATTAATPTKAETTTEILAELDGLIGLTAVKAQVRNVIAVVQANAERKKAGLATVNPSLHQVFTGPPGTGKTTVARIIARLYASVGALPGSAFVEASRADLIAGYIGQTALKTMEVIRKARPGVLFIDEAYSLAPSSERDFGSEAIATLVKAMEDHRDELAIIVAGYGDEMEVFIESNPGLRSRFKTYIDFPDYTAGELLQIFLKIAAEPGIALADGVREKAERIFTEVASREAFGNARFVRSLFEQAYARMAARAAADGTVEVSELQTITPDDVVLDENALQRERRRIGFQAE